MPPPHVPALSGQGGSRRSGRQALALVAALTLIAAAIRLALVGQSQFADELATYWIVSRHGLGGVISTVHSNAEITPPLFFVLSWMSTRIALTVEMLRLPSLLAGVAAVPLVYAVGTRTVGRRAALVAAALATLSPFMIFYSAEARGYAVMIALVLGSTLALLRAADEEGGARWWAIYALCSCGAMYTHYTAGFVLVAQAVWLLLARPHARRAMFLANTAAVLLFLPWTSGFLNDLHSPTTKILAQLEPFDLQNVKTSLTRWTVGYPYALPSTRVTSLPGAVGLVLLGLGVLGALVGVAARLPARRAARLGALASPQALIVILFLAVPLGEAAISLSGTHIFGVRNLASGWPAYALVLALLVTAPRRPLGALATGLVLASFVIGAVKLFEPRFRRPDFQAAAHFIDRTARPGDVIVDEATLSPGPIGPLDVALREPYPVLRFGRPQQNDHPFALFDRVAPVGEVAGHAVALAQGHRIIVVATSIDDSKDLAPVVKFVVPAITDQIVPELPRTYRKVASRVFPGIVRLHVLIFARTAPPE